MPYAGERLGRLIIKFLPAALAGEGLALLRELIDKKILGNESKVIEATVRLWPKWRTRQSRYRQQQKE
eukprot:4451972-Pleurochrysis_carterae.AAC.1